MLTPSLKDYLLMKLEVIIYQLNYQLILIIIKKQKQISIFKLRLEAIFYFV